MTDKQADLSGVTPDLPKSFRSALLDHASTHCLKASHTLIHAGEMGNGLYLLKRGLLKVLLPSPLHEEDAVVISMLRPGGVVGELSLIDDRRRSASVVAVIDSEVLFVSRQTFQHYAGQHPDIYKELAELLSARLRHTDDAVTATTFLTVKGRVARVLLELATVCGECDTKGVSISDTIRQKDIAAMAGLSRETVNRVLAELEHSEVVSHSNHRYRIPDLKALERELDAVDR